VKKNFHIPKEIISLKDKPFVFRVTKSDFKSMSASKGVVKEIKVGGNVFLFSNPLWCVPPLCHKKYVDKQSHKFCKVSRTTKTRSQMRNENNTVTTFN